MSESTPGSGYALSVERLEARLVDFEGQDLAAEIFLHAGSDRHPGAETLGERLNDPESRFLPCEIGGRAELVHLDWIAYVECRSELPELREWAEVGAERQPLSLILISGETLEGEMVYLRPPGSRRPSDHLNRSGERFLLVAMADGRSCFVNRRAIVRVHL